MITVVAPRPDSLRGRAGALLRKELAANGIEEWTTLHLAPDVLRQLRGVARVPALPLGRDAATRLLGVRNFMAARGFVWRIRAGSAARTREARVRAGLELSDYEAARVAAGKGVSKRARRAPTAEDLAAVAELEDRAALAGLAVIPTYEPEEVLSNDTTMAVFRADVARVARVARGAEGREDAGAHDTGGPELLEDLGERVAVDIETAGVDVMSTRMLCVGVDDGARTVVLHPWRAAWAAPLAAFLASRAEVVFHNGFGFDLLVLRRHGVIW